MFNLVEIKFEGILSYYTMSLDLITCLQFIERVIDKTKNLADSANLDTIGGLKTVRDSYVNLLWLQKKISGIVPQLDSAISEYREITENVTKKVQIVGQEIRTYDESPDVWSDWQSEGDCLEFPKNITNWSDQSEYEQVAKQITTMTTIGYPNPEKVGAIRRTANMFEMEIAGPATVLRGSSGFNFTRDTTDSPTSEVKSSHGAVYAASPSHGPPAASPAHGGAPAGLDSSPGLLSRVVPNHIIGTHVYEKSGMRLEIPIIDDIKNIPPMFYYYRGNCGKIKRAGQFYPGIYTRLANGTYVQVPEALEVVSDSSQRTMKCTNPKCQPYRCGFAHKGSNFKKVGIPARCPSCPRFGNTETLREDCVLATEQDVKMTLMYGMNDMFTAALWIEKNHFSGTFDELDLVN